MRGFIGSELVVKDLGFLQATYELNIIELRLIALANVVLRRKKNCINNPHEVVIRAEEYAQLFHTTLQNAYTVLKKAVKGLNNRIIENILSSEDRKINWTEECQYLECCGQVKILFSSKITSLLTDLKSNFLGYEIQNLKALTTPYSIRLYELGVAWKNKGVATFKYDTLRKKLGILDETKFPRTNNFNKMLKKALANINTETDIYLDLKPIYKTKIGKRGRYVYSYQLTVKRKPKTKDLGTSLTLRVDANGKWNYDEIVANINRIDLRIIGLDVKIIPKNILRKLEIYHKFKEISDDFALDAARNLIEKKVIYA